MALAVSAPAAAATPGPSGVFAQSHSFKAEPGDDGSQWDDASPAGGTGVDTGPQTAPDVAAIPEGAGVPDSSAVGQDAGGTGTDPGLILPPDTPSGPGLDDGGEPAGAIG
ncbi:hypothetical protein [Mycobacterium sp. 1274761.0]|uniref:hypothetical protein n=1 Tax=Mycobacterium sp. 1274761.0 TaxID=1834077 RepID=UPI0008003D6F|nr:hypothetical protein [Mycobacterium sp. 1274761.0]OBK71881.1 hypothetical protein A5651_17925 [Mycobacterium sp. 1274761.0]